MDTVSKKIEMNTQIKKIIYSNNLDGYILPKNDNYFTEYSKINSLKSITKFSGSAGFAIFLRDKKYLFVDGRYTIQAEEVGTTFEICEIPYVWPKNVLKKKSKLVLILSFSQQKLYINTLEMNITLF